jgi:tetratricopeptide (TPR) repeat protein
MPCATALAIMLFHELFDFNLQIPANAILFTAIFAMTLRLTAQALAPDRRQEKPLRPWLPAGAIALALLFTVLALNQELVPFPYNLTMAKSVAEAAERIHAHPAQAAGHIMMARLAAERSSPAEQSREYGIAVWLQPSDANLRDLYASALLREGRREQALQEISESVRLFPSLASHFYLNSSVVPWLSAAERLAIINGFKSAREPAALETLAAFFERGGDFQEQAKSLESASRQAKDLDAKIENAVNAGYAYVKAKNSAKAQELFQDVIALRPADARAHQALAVFIYAPAGNREQIAATIAEGIKHQANPVPLYLSLAQAMHLTGATMAAQAALRQANDSIDGAEKRGENILPLLLALAETAEKIGQHDGEREALEKAVEIRPSSIEVLHRLAAVYQHLQRYDRAAHILQRITELRPDSADAFFQLAGAEESRYGYAAADAAYARAAELAPGNLEFASRRDALKQIIAANLKTEQAK